MKSAFIIVSVSDRIDDLNGLVRSIMARDVWNKYDLCLLFQDPDGVIGKLEHPDRFAHIHVEPRLMGCHAARVRLLKQVRYDQYVNLDDDMELTEYTDYEAVWPKVHHPDTGFVLTNWARTRALLDAKVPKLRPAFLPQVMVYQGGGMCYRDEIADLMRALPEVPQTFDHAWPLTAYVNGYLNFRFMGSLAIHRICSTGGMRAYMDATPPATMMTEFINFREVKKSSSPGRSLCIPLDADLKPEAHLKHTWARGDRIHRTAPKCKEATA